MKIKRWFSPKILGVTLATMMSVPTLGKIVTVNKSIEIARQYVNISKSAGVGARRIKGVSHDAQPYYIYNDNRGHGFVVVAGDDAMGQVLGYSKTGTLDTLRASQELKFLLGVYSDAFYQLQRQPAARSASTANTRQSRRVVTPLLASAWNQDEPYNSFTGYKYTGCVATAMAQIMYYHRWPERGEGSYSYVVRYDNRTMSVDFSKSVYQWDKMLPRYNTPKALADTEACNAVALLMRDVGVAVNMQYSPSSSGAQTFMAAKALKTYFNYSTSMLNKSDEGGAAFTQILRREIENGFPVYISGSVKSGGSGHAWVVDGVDKDNFFHMNFGWGGNGDGYFSVTALNLNATGQEFGGRPLSFNKQVQIVLVHPNKPDVIPIDDELADDAPNLAFNLGGGMAVVGEKPADKQQKMTVGYHHFINQADGAFAGDIGVGVYDEQGKLLKAVPSAWHDAGGYTAERSKYTGGALVSGQLIDDECTFTVSLADLSDGRYYLLPVCAAKKDNGSYGAWCRMKKAPRLAFEVKDGGTVRIFEEPDDNAPFALTSHPYTLKPCTAGSNITLYMTIRKLNGTPFDGTVRVSLVDDEGHTAVTGQTTDAVDFEEFAETDVRVDMLLPENLQTKAYTLKIEVIKKNDTDKIVTVGMVHGNEPSTLQVEASKLGDRLFTQLLGMVQDNSESTISPTKVDLSDNPPLKIGVVMTLSPHASYNGKLTLCLIDTQTQRRIPLGRAAQKQWNLEGGATETFITGWLKNKDNLPVINNRIYRLALMGKADGEETDLWNDNCEPFEMSFINGVYDVYPDEPTGIDPTESSLHMVREKDRIAVQGDDVAHVQVFALDGTLLAAAKAAGQRLIKLHIPVAQVVIVKVRTANGGTVVRKLR